MATGIPTKPTVKQRSVASEESRRRAYRWLAKYGTIMGMLIMIVIFSIAAPRSFPSARNFINVLNQVSLTAIIAGGLTVAVIVGELDLSIGYSASFAGVLVTGLLVNQGWPVILSIAVVLLVTVIIGLVNGAIVTKAKVNSVIATLGTGAIIVGLNYAYSTGKPIATGVPDNFLSLALGKVFGVIPNNIVTMFIVLTALWIIINRTEVGQWIQAVGGNVSAARLSGIRVDRVVIFSFVITAICAGITGILLASLIGSGTTTAGDAYLLNAFAAVFLGSATLRDGEFHILGTFIGVLIIGIGFNGLAIIGVPTFFQYIFQGAILVGAVALSSIARQAAKN